MKYPWIEELVEKGQISKEAAERIYSDCEALRKDPIVKEAQSAGMQRALDVGMGAVVAPAVMALVNRAVSSIESSARTKSIRESIQKTHDEIVSKSTDKQLASKRFNELAQVAPLVAANPNLAKKVIEKAMRDGFSHDDLTKLMTIQASLTPEQFGNIRVLTPKTASVSLEAVGTIAADMYAMVKSAGAANQAASSVGKGGMDFLRKYVPAALTLALGSLAAGSVVGGVNAIKARVDRNKLKKQLDDSFMKAMKASDPDREPLHANKAQAREAFEALSHFAPAVALQPQAARSFMNKIVAYNQQMNVQDIKDLTEIQRNTSQVSRQDPFLEGLVGGAQAFGLGGAISGLQGETGKRMGNTMMNELGYPDPKKSQ